MKTDTRKTEVSLGLPVELGRIEKELAKLWQQGEGVLTRASLINFAVCCKGEAAMRENTELIAEFMRSHACRAILIALEPEATETRIQSWISAHCHVSRAGAKQVCCEQMTFLMEGETQTLIPSIVFSHLDSDLPLYFWWQGDFPETIDEQLWTWVDRLIFDSAHWSDTTKALAALNEIRASTRGRMVLCDLNWTRLVYWRRALMRVFDNPDNLSLLSGIEQVKLQYAPGFRSTAVLFAAWIASQLGHVIQVDPATGVASFGKTRLMLEEKDGAALGECVLTSIDAEFVLRQPIGGDYIHALVRSTDGRASEDVLPSRTSTTLALLDEELTRGGRRPLYLKTLTAGEALL